MLNTLLSKNKPIILKIEFLFHYKYFIIHYSCFYSNKYNLKSKLLLFELFLNHDISFNDKLLMDISIIWYRLYLSKFRIHLEFN